MPTQGDYVSYNSMQQNVGIQPPPYQPQQFTPFLGQILNTPFQNPYQSQLSAMNQNADSQYMGAFSAAGVGARLGTNFGFGAAGAAIGSRFGARGAVAGGFVGFLGSELSGAGTAGQGLFANYVAAPFIANRAATASMEEMSQGFSGISSPFLNMSGQGFSHAAAHQAASGIGNLANNQFNKADFYKITQSSAQNGLLGNVGNPTQMISRVKEISQSLSAFMQLANEPDIQKAIKTMGELRSSGLNLTETLQAVSNGRSYARLAGTTFEELSQVGGGLGAQAFGARGLTGGLGYQVGMQNYAMARSANLSSSMMNLLGGAQGYANSNNQFSAGTLQLPMFAPGMMTGQGGISGHAINNLLSGNTNLFNMTSRGSNALTQMTGNMGIEGLGMAVAMQPLLQDSVGRLIQSQGPFAQRNMEDRQIIGLSRQLGMRGSAGFMTAAQAMGMTQSQAVARAGELSDPQFFERQRQQIRTRAREEASTERQQIRDNAPGVFDELASQNSTLYGLGRRYNNLALGVEHLFSHPDEMYQTQSSFERRNMRRYLRSNNLFDSEINLPMNQRRTGSRLFDAIDIAENRRGGSGISSVLGGLGIAATSSRSELDAEMRGMEQDRRSSATLRNTSRLDLSSDRGASLFNNNSVAQADFARNVANLYNNSQAMGGSTGATAVNTLFRAGANYLTGFMYDPGNIVGNRDVNTSQIKDEYVRSMMNTGMSRQAAEQQFINNQSSILSNVSGQVRGRLNNVGQNQMDTQATRTVTPNRGINLREMEEQAYQGFGSNVARNAGSRRSMDRLMNMFGEGFGRTEQARSKSRNYMAAYAALRVQMQDPAKRDQAQRQMEDLEQRASAEGVDIERVRETVSERERTGDLGGREMRSAIENLSTTDITAQMFEGADRNRTRTRAIQTLGRGFTELGRQEGALGDLFRGVMSENGQLDLESLQRRMRTMSPDSLRQLQRRDPRMAQLLNRFNRAGSPREQQRIMQELQGAVGEVGEQALQDEQESTRLGYTGRFRESFNSNQGLFSSLMNAISPERFTAQRNTAGTQAGRRAQRDLGAVDQAQAEAEGAGIGSASDSLLAASRELSEAARSLNRTTGSNFLDGLFPGST